MSITPLTTEPAALYAGDSINWQIALADFPASAGWTLKYNAVASGGRFTLASVASGDDHAVTALASETAAYAPGTYSTAKYIEHSDGTRVTLAELSLIVKPNLAGKTAAFDNRSHVKRTLDAIEAVLEGTATTDQQELTIDGTNIKRRTVADLIKLRQFYISEYRAEQQAARIASGMGGGSNIYVRFV